MIEFNVTIPRKKFASKKWIEAIRSKQRAKSLPMLRKLFRETVNGWSNKPTFAFAQTRTSDELSIRVFSSGQYGPIWDLVNEGSPPHSIDPKEPGGFLRFRPGYRAATRPGQLRSGRKHRSGKYISSKHVDHPGFAPRKFTELIAKEFSDKYYKDMQDAVLEVARR